MSTSIEILRDAYYTALPLPEAQLGYSVLFGVLSAACWIGLLWYLLGPVLRRWGDRTFIECTQVALACVAVLVAAGVLAGASWRAAQKPLNEPVVGALVATYPSGRLQYGIYRVREGHVVVRQVPEVAVDEEAILYRQHPFSR